MSKRHGLFGDSEKRGMKPPHPDWDRWVVACFGFAVVVIGLWGPPLAWWLTRRSTQWERFVQTHLRPLSMIRQGLEYGVLFFLGVTVLGAVWTAVVWTRWWWRLRRLDGQYLTLVIPRPQHRRATTHANPEASSLLWDRLIATLQLTRQRGMPPYLAAELWGNAGGRVEWGVWLPDHVGAQRDVVRRLLTADRPQARLVDAPDPLTAALLRRDEEREDTGTRWYASAVLILHARDYYPLLDDALTQRSLVAALRPPRAVVARGISVIATPAPDAWAQRVSRLVERWRWEGRYTRRFDERWKQETDEISLKAQQAHARVCLRVHVIAHTRSAAMEECRTLVTTLTTSRKRYRRARQYWQPRRVSVHQVRGTRLPPAGRVRAPFRPLPRLMPLFPFV